MSDNSSIEWTEATWSPTTGCDKISPGCGLPRPGSDDEETGRVGGCYALTLAKRLKAMGSAKYQTDGDPRTSGPGFGVATHDAALPLPLTWKKPRLVFVNSMSDLFHARVPREFVAQVFAVMALTPQHTYQCLTKRPRRMQRILSDQAFQRCVAQAMDAMLVDQEHDSVETWKLIPGFNGYEASSHGRVRGRSGLLATCDNPMTGRESVTLWNFGQPKTMTVHRLVLMAHRPTDDGSLEACHRNGDKRDNRLANLRWGTRSENQLEKTRHGRAGGPRKLSLDQVQEIRAARRSGVRQQALADRFGVSRSLISMVESEKVWAKPDLEWPLPNVWLGTSIESDEYVGRADDLRETPAAVRFISAEPLLGPLPSLDLTRIDWLIAGGESGPHARPVDPGWIRDLRDRCLATGPSFFFKQWGGRTPKANGRELDGRTWDEMPERVVVGAA